MEKYLIAFFAAFGLQLILVKAALYFFPKIGLMDNPGKYKLKRAPIPYGGGILIFLCFVALSVIFLPFDWKLAGIVVAATLLVIVSFVDDFRVLSPAFRLIVQIVAAGIIIATGTFIAYFSNPIGATIDLQQWLFFGVPIVAFGGTVFWLLFVTNMVNWIDGVNGLSSGIAVIAAVSVFVLSARPDFHTVDQTMALYMSAILAGCALAFWLFEVYPAKILMGDSGSMFLGFVIAILAIVSGGKLATAFIVLAIPILDGVWTIGRRILKGQSPFKGDLLHFHHKLLDLGISPRSVLLLYYIVTIIFAIIALKFSGKEKLFAIIMLLLIMTFWEILVGRMGKMRRKS
ncbi:undecaprenyl/decaprenyl-phosphate alpha-N-acetylglucosaminyl 1-phosphate transferase [Patescibacteria group bacterium]|nr:undecaprenyl/decaprenyl-phosphate alpha-N-acetylglucosaminyl 1-phosphate transferase [Patescibacteria group bacterium]